MPLIEITNLLYLKLDQTTDIEHILTKICSFGVH